MLNDRSLRPSYFPVHSRQENRLNHFDSSIKLKIILPTSKRNLTIQSSPVKGLIGSLSAVEVQKKFYNVKRSRRHEIVYLTHQKKTNKEE
jgi:hypothetical protein